MLYICEFEFYASDGCMLAVPFGLEGGTFGESLDDAVQSAADWLHETGLLRLQHGEPLESTGFGHEPQHGGKVIAVAVECDLSTIPSMSAADAARELGVSTARVAQMCKAGALESWKVGSRRMISTASVREREKECPQPGRPPKTGKAPMADKATATGKLLKAGKLPAAGKVLNGKSSSKAKKAVA